MRRADLIRLWPLISTRPRHNRAISAAATLALAVLVCNARCAGYNEEATATRLIGTVRVTTRESDVAACRWIRRVDSRDESVGCGLTVQPTPEECLRYQVRRAGGDTLLMRGPSGEAYACSATEPAAAPGGGSSASTPGAPVAVAPTPAPVPVSPTPEAIGSPAVTQAPPPPGPWIRATVDRDGARGCVYLGDLPAGIECPVADGRAAGDCATRGLAAGADLVVVEAGRAQIFSCKARP